MLMLEGIAPFLVDRQLRMSLTRKCTAFPSRDLNTMPLSTPGLSVSLALSPHSSPSQRHADELARASSVMVPSLPVEVARSHMQTCEVLQLQMAPSSPQRQTLCLVRSRAEAAGIVRRMRREPPVRGCGTGIRLRSIERLQGAQLSRNVLDASMQTTCTSQLRPQKHPTNGKVGGCLACTPEERAASMVVKAWLGSHSRALTKSQAVTAFCKHTTQLSTR